MLAHQLESTSSFCYADMTRRSQKSMKDHLASSQGNLALPPPLPHLCTMRFHAGYKTRMFLMLSVGTGHSVPQCLACTVVCGAPVNLFQAIKPTWNWNSVLSTLLSRMAVFNIVSLLKISVSHLYFSLKSGREILPCRLCVLTDHRNQRLPFCAAQHHRAFWSWKPVRTNQQMKLIYPPVDAKELTQEWKLEFGAFQIAWPRFGSHFLTSAAV